MAFFPRVPQTLVGPKTPIKAAFPTLAKVATPKFGAPGVVTPANAPSGPLTVNLPKNNLPSGSLDALRSNYQQLAAGQSALPGILSSLIGQRDKVIPGLDQERTNLQDQQASLAPTLRAQLVGKVQNPFLIEQEIANQDQGLNNQQQQVNSMEQSRGQDINSLIQRAQDLYGGLVTNAQNAYQNTRQDQQDVLDNQLKRAQIANELRLAGGGGSGAADPNLDPTTMAQDLLSGKTAPSQLRALYGSGSKAAGAIQMATDLAMKLNPNWSPAQSEGNYQAMTDAAKNLGSSTVQNQLRVGNALVSQGGLLDQLQGKANALNVSGLPIIQQLQLFAKKQSGNPDLLNYSALHNDVASQISQLFSGGNAPTDRAMQNALKALPNASPSQMKSIISTLKPAIQERLKQYSMPSLNPAYQNAPSPLGITGGGLSQFIK